MVAPGRSHIIGGTGDLDVESDFIVGIVGRANALVGAVLVPSTETSVICGEGWRWIGRRRRYRTAPTLRPADNGNDSASGEAAGPVVGCTEVGHGPRTAVGLLLRLRPLWGRFAQFEVGTDL